MVWKYSMCEPIDEIAVGNLNSEMHSESGRILSGLCTAWSAVVFPAASTSRSKENVSGCMGNGIAFQKISVENAREGVNLTPNHRRPPLRKSKTRIPEKRPGP